MPAALGSAAIFHKVHSIQITRVEAVALQHFSCKVALQRCEAEALIRIPLQAELNQAVA